jgi:hypothetical protein
VQTESSTCSDGRTNLHAYTQRGSVVDTGKEVNMPLMKWDQLYKRWVKLDAVKVRITHVCAHVDSRHSLIPTNPIAQEDGTDEVEKEISKVHEAAAAAKARIREKRKMTARPNPEIDSIAIKDEGTSNPGACELGNSASRTIVDILRPCPECP